MQFAMWIYPQETVNGLIVYRLTTIKYMPYTECGEHIEEETTGLKHIFSGRFIPLVNNTSIFRYLVYLSEY